MNLLTIDIGNTNITLGVYHDQTLDARWRIATAAERTADEYGLQLLGLFQHSRLRPASLSGIALASVVPPLTSPWVEACQQYLRQVPLVVDAGVKPGCGCVMTTHARFAGQTGLSTLLQCKSVWWAGLCGRFWYSDHI